MRAYALIPNEFSDENAVQGASTGQTHSASKSRLRKITSQGIEDTGENGDGVRTNAPSIRGLRPYKMGKLSTHHFCCENECPVDQGIETKTGCD